MIKKTSRLMRVPEAAERLAVKESTVRKMLHLKKLPVIRIGRAVAIPEDAIEAMIRAGYTAAKAEG